MNKQKLTHLYSNADPNLFKVARWVTLEEAEVLRTVAEVEEPDFIFESGTANGFSTMWLAMYGCDVYTFDPVSRAKVWDIEGKPSHIHYTKDVFDIMPEIAQNLPGKKLFFIDGLHTSKGVKDDLDAVKKVVSRDDVVVFHDLNIRHVVRFWDRMNDNALSFETYPTKRGMGKLVWAG